LIEQGVPNEPAQGKEGVTTIFSFPVKSPESSVVVDDTTALSQLEIWKMYQDHWCEHKPSCTVYYTDDEFPDMSAWVWRHFDEISGVSFLPKSEHTYAQAPYQEISEETYNELVSAMPDIDWDTFTEDYDNTTSSQTYACSGAGGCEL